MLITYGDNKYLKKIIKFKKFTSIEAGIKKTVLWFNNYKDKKSLNFWSNYFKVIPDKQKALKKSLQI